jgi:deoxyribodipyrimidine photo-lyase
MADGPYLYRFARDLRLEDHAGLAAAAVHGAVVPVLVIDRSLEERIARSPRRAAYFCGAVRDLDEALRARGSALIVRRGPAGPAIKHLAHAIGASGAAWSASYEGDAVARDTRLQSELEESGLRAEIVHDAPAIAPDEIGAEHAGYRAFAPYFARWCDLPLVPEHAVPARFFQTELRSEPLPLPNEFGAHEREIAAGSTHAQAALDRFMRECAVQYALAANVPADERTSHLSAHLSFGAISGRSVVRAIRERFDDPFLLAEERVSLRRFHRALAMRDFFLQLSWFHPQTAVEPLQEKMHGFAFERTHPALDAWRGGRTGYPLVDAGIRELHATGWMHPHVRAVAASFLCYDLGVDWKVGCDEWERWLIEDDPALAVGNWQWIAGVGADMAQYPRIYNPERQRKRFDPSGVYVRRWVHELQHLPVGVWNGARDHDQLSLDLFAAEPYPRPVVDHDVVARAYLNRYKEFLGAPSR